MRFSIKLFIPIHFPSDLFASTESKCTTQHYVTKHLASSQQRINFQATQFVVIPLAVQFWNYITWNMENLHNEWVSYFVLFIILLDPRRMRCYVSCNIMHQEIRICKQNFGQKTITEESIWKTYVLMGG